MELPRGKQSWIRPGVELAQAFLPWDLLNELDGDTEAIPDETGHGRLAGRESEHPEG